MKLINIATFLFCILLHQGVTSQVKIPNINYSEIKHWKNIPIDEIMGGEYIVHKMEMDNASELPRTKRIKNKELKKIKSESLVIRVLNIYLDTLSNEIKYEFDTNKIILYSKVNNKLSEVFINTEKKTCFLWNGYSENKQKVAFHLPKLIYDHCDKNSICLFSIFPYCLQCKPSESFDNSIFNTKCNRPYLYFLYNDKPTFYDFCHDQGSLEDFLIFHFGSVENYIQVYKNRIKSSQKEKNAVIDWNKNTTIYDYRIR